MRFGSPSFGPGDVEVLDFGAGCLVSVLCSVQNVSRVIVPLK